MINTEQRAKLVQQGFHVEDMTQAYGQEFSGQWRWLNSITGDFQDGCTSDSEDEAWTDAYLHTVYQEAEKSFPELDRLARKVSQS